MVTERCFSVRRASKDCERKKNGDAGEKNTTLPMQKKENPPRLFSNLVKFAFVFCWKIYSCDALFLRILSDSELKECKILRGHHIAWERSVFRKAVYMLQACECECVCVYCAVTSSVKTSKGGVHSVRRYS